jgi:hypothetical protein
MRSGVSVQALPVLIDVSSSCALEGVTGVKIVARIEKVAADQYLLDGKSFDSFLNARREMAERIKRRRLERQARTSRRGMVSLRATGA